MDEVIAVISQKGGVGKSTTAQAIGSEWSLKGRRVLFVDLDAQGNLSYSLGADNQGLTVMDILTKEHSAKEAIRKTESGDLIRSSPALGQADSILITTGKEYRLKEALKPILKEYHYIVIDTPPALGILTVNALTACTGVVIPAQADIYSIQGISQIYDTIDSVRRYCNPGLKIKGIVLTRFNARAVISRVVAETLKEKAGELHTQLYETRIRECTAVKEAQATKKSIYQYAPNSNAARDYKALVNEMTETKQHAVFFRRKRN